MSESFWIFFMRLGQTVLQQAPWLFAGLLVAAIIRRIPADRVRALLGGGHSAPFRGAIVGLLLPVSSLGLIPVLIELHRRSVDRRAWLAIMIAGATINPLSIIYLLEGLSGMWLGLLIAQTLFIAATCGFMVGRDRPDSAHLADDRFDVAIRDTFKGVARSIMAGRGLSRGWLAILLAVLASTLVATFVPAGLLGHALFDEGRNIHGLAEVALVAPFALLTPEDAAMQTREIANLGTAPPAVIVWLIVGGGLHAGLFMLLFARFKLLRAISILITLAICLAACALTNDRLTFDETRLATSDTHALDPVTRPFKLTGSPDELPRDAAFRIVRRDASPIALASLAALGLLAFVGTFRKPLLSDVPPRSSASVDRPIIVWTKRALVVATLLGIVVTSLYAYFPAPTVIARELKMLDAELTIPIRESDELALTRTLDTIRKRLDDIRWSILLRKPTHIRRFDPLLDRARSAADALQALPAADRSLTHPSIVELNRSLREIEIKLLSPTQTRSARP